ncbi:MAG: arsenate reductase [Planctomycetota bacterium]|nr:MAG: arsenate reductase [Planctomycetota bacterium]
MTEKIKILFLCTGNSCRSQMAEGWAKQLKGDQCEFFSAGIETHGLNPNAVKVMSEAGVDISHHQSQNINEFKEIKLNFVITVCGNAHETCPVFANDCNVIHVGFDDPPKLANEIEKRGGTAEEQIECYRLVRDKIKNYIETLPSSLSQS